mgnify:CR=1 FL=1
MTTIQQEVDYASVSLDNHLAFLASDMFAHIDSVAIEALKQRIPYLKAGLRGESKECGLESAQQFFADCHYAYKNGRLPVETANAAS